MRTGRPHTLPPGPYAALAAKVEGVGALAGILHVARSSVSRAAQEGRWLNGEPGMRLYTLCRAYEIQIPDGMKPAWIR